MQQADLKKWSPIAENHQPAIFPHPKGGFVPSTTAPIDGNKIANILMRRGKLLGVEKHTKVIEMFANTDWHKYQIAERRNLCWRRFGTINIVTINQKTLTKGLD